VTYQRAYYYDPAARAGCYPLDDQLGLTSPISDGVSRGLVKLSARLPYRTAVEVYEELTQVRVSVGAAWARTQAAGQRARPALDPLPTLKAPADPVACVGISMDGFMAHVRGEGWKEVKLGAVFEARARGTPEVNPHGHPREPVHASAPSYVMHLGGPEGFGVKLAVEAQARQWGCAAQSVVLGDGAAWIWNLAAQDYPSAAHVVDWYHAKQHLCAAAGLLPPTQPDPAAAWVAQHAALLYDGHADQIADCLTRQAGSAPPDCQAALVTEAGYFAANHERMQYRDFQQAQVPIGSGTVESAAKQAKQRLTAAGMRWSRPGLENMLPLRAAVMSGTFDLLWPRICPVA
jgi:hypothetical protein